MQSNSTFLPSTAPKRSGKWDDRGRGLCTREPPMPDKVPISLIQPSSRDHYLSPPWLRHAQRTLARCRASVYDAGSAPEPVSSVCRIPAVRPEPALVVWLWPSWHASSERPPTLSCRSKNVNERAWPRTINISLPVLLYASQCNPCIAVIMVMSQYSHFMNATIVCARIVIRLHRLHFIHTIRFGFFILII